MATTHDLYLNEHGGTVATLKVRGSVPAGNHTVEITALFDRNAASAGYYFYFDHLWPLVPQDVPDPPQEYQDVSPATGFDIDHGYKKPPAWHLWQLQRLGFKGHAGMYLGVFWNIQRQRVGAVYPYTAVVFSGDPAPTSAPRSTGCSPACGPTTPRARARPSGFNPRLPATRSRAWRSARPTP